MESMPVRVFVLFCTALLYSTLHLVNDIGREGLLRLNKGILVGDLCAADVNAICSK